MANIYARKADSEFANRYYQANGNGGQLMQKQAATLTQIAAADKEIAQNLYGNELDLETSTKFNELINSEEYRANPEAIKGAMNGIIQSTAAHIADSDLRASFLTGAQKSSMQYVNQALKNRSADIKEAQREAKAEAKAAASEQRAIAREQRAEQRAIEREQRAEQRAEAKSQRARQLKSYKAQTAVQLIGLFDEYSENPEGLTSAIGQMLSDTASGISDEGMRQDFYNDAVISAVPYVAQAAGNRRKAAQKAVEKQEALAQKQADKKEQREYSENLYNERTQERREYQESREQAKKEEAERQKTAESDREQAQKSAVGVFDSKLTDIYYNPSFSANPEAFEREAVTWLNQVAQAKFDDEREREKFINSGISEINKLKKSVSQNADDKAKTEKSEIEKVYSDGLKNDTKNFFDGLLSNPKDETNIIQFETDAKAYKEKMLSQMSKDGATSLQKYQFESDFANQYGIYYNKVNANARAAQEQMKNSRLRENYNTSLDNLKLLGEQLNSPDVTATDLANTVAAQKKIDELIYAKNPNGTFVYDDKQRQQMIKEVQDVLVKSAEVGFLQLPDWQKKTFLDNFKDGTVAINGSKVQVLTGDSVARIKDFARTWLEKNKAALDSGFNQEEASRKAGLKVMALSELQTQHDAMYETDKNGKITGLKGKTDVVNMLEYRRNIISHYTAGNLDREDYDKLYQETIGETLKLMKQYDPEKGMPDYTLGFAYKSLMTQINPDDSLSDSQKVYFLQSLYDRLVAWGVDPDSQEWFMGDELKGKVKKVVSATARDFVEDKDAGVLGKDIDNVLVGSHVYAYTSGKGVQNSIKTHHSKVIQNKKTGEYWKFFYDEAGNVTQKINLGVK